MAVDTANGALVNPFELADDDGYEWLKGNLHSHTTNSDGKVDPQRREQMLRSRMREIQAELGETDPRAEEINEYRLKLEELGLPDEALTESMKQLGVSVREIYDADIMVGSRVDQPLVNAGWGALLVLLFLAVALASGSGVMLFSFLDTKERQTEFALLRTLGSTGGQLRYIVWFNLFLIVICGVVLGTWMGHLIGSSLLPIMEVAEEGERVTPPMAFTTDWLALGVAYLVLIAVTAGTVLWLAWLSSKIQVQQVLRMGDAG